jgi:hypothetical protein
LPDSSARGLASDAFPRCLQWFPTGGFSNGGAAPTPAPLPVALRGAALVVAVELVRLENEAIKAQTVIAKFAVEDSVTPSPLYVTANNARAQISKKPRRSWWAFVYKYSVQA